MPKILILKQWTAVETKKLMDGVRKYGTNWEYLQNTFFPERKPQDLERKYRREMEYFSPKKKLPIRKGTRKKSNSPLVAIWTPREDQKLKEAVERHSRKWDMISEEYFRSKRTPENSQKLKTAVEKHGRDWAFITQEYFDSKWTPAALFVRFCQIQRKEAVNERIQNPESHITFDTQPNIRPSVLTIPPTTGVPLVKKIVAAKKTNLVVQTSPIEQSNAPEKVINAGEKDPIINQNRVATVKPLIKEISRGINLPTIKELSQPKAVTAVDDKNLIVKATPLIKNISQITEKPIVKGFSPTIEISTKNQIPSVARFSRTKASENEEINQEKEMPKIKEPLQNKVITLIKEIPEMRKSLNIKEPSKTKLISTTSVMRKPPTIKESSQIKISLIKEIPEARETPTKAISPFKKISLVKKAPIVKEPAQSKSILPAKKTYEAIKEPSQPKLISLVKEISLIQKPSLNELRSSVKEIPIIQKPLQIKLKEPFKEIPKETKSPPVKEFSETKVITPVKEIPIVKKTSTIPIKSSIKVRKPPTKVTSPVKEIPVVRELSKAELYLVVQLIKMKEQGPSSYKTLSTGLICENEIPLEIGTYSAKRSRLSQSLAMEFQKEYSRHRIRLSKILQKLVEIDSPIGNKKVYYSPSISSGKDKNQTSSAPTELSEEDKTRLRYHELLHPTIPIVHVNQGPFNPDEKMAFDYAFLKYGDSWDEISEKVGSRTPQQCMLHWRSLKTSKQLGK
ncbi:hypothetical protein G9A89_007266 [Geosiphon pyriformis]|nr:hypothetical protein G9A89_007266 [Geosiphon pyriformis]